MQTNRFPEANITVCCRFKPLTPREKQSQVFPVFRKIAPTTLHIETYKDFESNQFTFDEVFDTEASQADVYQAAARPIVSSVLEGFNGTIFAYGQTSSGKTHTILGPGLSQSEKGIIPRVIEQVFGAIGQAPLNIEFRIKVSIMELYLEKIRDLLDPSKNDLKIRQSLKKGTYVQDITEKNIFCQAELATYLQVGNKNRVTAATNMNERSSRSHLIFAITIYQSNLQDLSTKFGKLYIVDLAGSQKIDKSGVVGKSLKQANTINSSLATLSKVIKCLSEAKEGRTQHIPYRESKLTRILRQSLGGNSKTALIITCSPHPNNIQETMSTLRFGVIAKKVRNRAIVNKEKNVAELQMQLDKLFDENSQLQKRIKAYQNYILQQMKASLPVLISKPSHKPPLPRPRNTDDSGSGSGSATVIGDDNEEKIKVLQFELECQRAIVSKQTQEISELRRLIDGLNDRIYQLENQNSRLKQDLEEPVVASRDRKIESSNDYSQFKLPLTDRTEPKTLCTNNLNESLLVNNDTHRKSLASIVQQILSVVRPEEVRLSAIEQLRRKRWYREIESCALSLNMSYEDKSLIHQNLETLSENRIDFNCNNFKLKRTVIIEQEEELESQDTEKKMMEHSAELGIFDAYENILELEHRWRQQYHIFRTKVQIDQQQTKHLEEELRKLQEEGSLLNSRLPKPIIGGRLRR